LLAKKEKIGPLHGVPFTAKDSFETAGVISTSGTSGRAAFVPKSDATAVARLKAAGAILLAKTNLPELSLGFESDNDLFGSTSNPYDLTRTAGGSSGGEAAIIAAGGSPLGLGTDGGGSLRDPAHFCGIATLKPTRGRIPYTGVFPPALGIQGRLSHVGPMARRVADLILTFPILAGPDWRDPYIAPVPIQNAAHVKLKELRLAFYTDNGYKQPDEETLRVVKQAVSSLAEEGLTVEEARPPGLEQAYELFYSLTTLGSEENLQKRLKLLGTDQPSEYFRLLVAKFQFRTVSSEELGANLARWDYLASTMLSFWRNHDLLICPVAASPALPHRASLDDTLRQNFSYNQPYNLTGWPVVVVRCGTSQEGLPIGLQLIAPPWREDLALAAAKLLETKLGGWQPPRL
jgi:amidase